MKVTQDITSESRTYTAPAMRACSLTPCFPVCLQASNGAKTEDYEEEDIWNL